MINNDVLRSLRYMLKASEARVVQICALGGYALAPELLSNLLKKEDEEGFVACRDEVLAHFLAGLVIDKRGLDPNRPPLPVEKRLSNNIILKKLRVAFNLRDDDIQAILQEADLPMTKSELGALFRSPEHKHYRNCGDQILRNFLRGLTRRLRP